MVATLQQPLYPGLPALEQAPGPAWRQQALQLWEPAAAEVQDRTAPAVAEPAGRGMPGRRSLRTQLPVSGLYWQTHSSCTLGFGAQVCSQVSKLQPTTQDLLLLAAVDWRSGLTLRTTTAGATLPGNRAMQKLQSFDDLDLDSPTEEWRNNEHFAANIGSNLRPGTAVVTHVQMAWHPQGKSASSSCSSPRQVVLLCCLVLAAQVQQSSLIYSMHGTPSSRCWSFQPL